MSLPHSIPPWMNGWLIALTMNRSLLFYKTIEDVGCFHFSGTFVLPHRIQLIYINTYWYDNMQHQHCSLQRTNASISYSNSIFHTNAINQFDIILIVFHLYISPLFLVGQQLSLRCGLTVFCILLLCLHWNRTFWRAKSFYCPAFRLCYASQHSIIQQMSVLNATNFFRICYIEHNWMHYHSHSGYEDGLTKRIVWAHKDLQHKKSTTRFISLLYAVEKLKLCFVFLLSFTLSAQSLFVCSHATHLIVVASITRIIFPDFHETEVKVIILKMNNEYLHCSYTICTYVHIANGAYTIECAGITRYNDNFVDAIEKCTSSTRIRVCAWLCLCGVRLRNRRFHEPWTKWVEWKVCTNDGTATNGNAEWIHTLRFRCISLACTTTSTTPYGFVWFA